MRSAVVAATLIVAAAAMVAGVAGQSQSQSGNTSILIGSMNIQVFGPSKASNGPVMDTLVRILKRFDVFAVQEIRDSGNTAFPALMQRLNANVTGVRSYAYVIGSRQGRTTSKEQYAFVYDTTKLRAVGWTWEYNVTRDQFERPPFAAQFALTGAAAGAAPFVLVDVHTKPDAAVAEIDALADVYDAVALNMSNANALTMGDFNAGCSYVSNSAWAGIRFRSQSRFTWLIPDSADTMQSSACPYDRFVVAGAELTRALVASSAGPFDYTTQFGLDPAFALTVSDHLPIQVTLSVTNTNGNGADSSTADASTGLNGATRAGADSFTVALAAALFAAVSTRRAL